MRCRSLVLLSALLMLLTGCAQEAPAEPIFAIVEGVEIPVSRVDHTLALDEAAYESPCAGSKTQTSSRKRKSRSRSP